MQMVPLVGRDGAQTYIHNGKSNRVQSIKGYIIVVKRGFLYSMLDYRI
jgi:hypothetical protein